MFVTWWVQTLALYTGWTFFTLICCKNCIAGLKKTENKREEAGVDPFKKI